MAYAALPMTGPPRLGDPPLPPRPYVERYIIGLNRRSPEPDTDVHQRPIPMASMSTADPLLSVAVACATVRNEAIAARYKPPYPNIPTSSR